jgi:hypothetical protein
MKIAFLPNDESVIYRIQHLLNTISEKHSIVRIKNINEVNKDKFDILIMDYYCPSNVVSSMCLRLNSFKEQLLKFKGKLVLFSLDDGQAIYTNELDVELIDRVNAWIVYMIHTDYLNIAPKINRELLTNKFIKIPRYTIPYVKCDDVVYEHKENKIVFVGRTTGNYWFNNKNWRVESLNKIWNNSILKSHFDGWLVDDVIIDVDKQDEEYNKTFKFVKKGMYISEHEWQHKLKCSTLSLCLPGHTKFAYRHPQSMAFKSTMLANFDFENDPYPWLFSEKLKDISYTVKSDLSNFDEICEEALLNREKSKQYALNSYDVYKNYFELTEKNAFKPHIYDIVTQQFNNAGIYGI